MCVKVLDQAGAPLFATSVKHFALKRNMVRVLISEKYK